MERIADKKIYDSLICPCCKGTVKIENDGKSLICDAPRRHCFDFSSIGYVNLAPNHSGGGDSKAAVRSRTDFLDSGAYGTVSDAINGILAEYVGAGAFVIDAGCGEGYYSCRAASAGFSVAGFDLSKDAIAAAAKRAKKNNINNAFFGVASVFELPIRDASADAVINIFAPCTEGEYSRVLKPEGILAIAYAGPEHLMGLKRRIYDEVYDNEARADMPCEMELLGERRVRYEMKLMSNKQINDLFSMTPYYWRTSQEDKEKLSSIEELYTEVDIIIAIYKKKFKETV